MKPKPAITDAFYSDFDWYMGHVYSLSLSPDKCCEDQGGYNVAAELFYFLLQPTMLLDDPIGLVSETQTQAIHIFRESLLCVPEEARSGTSLESSLENMRHEAWETPRHNAQELIISLNSIFASRDAYYSD